MKNNIITYSGTEKIEFVSELKGYKLVNHTFRQGKGILEYTEDIKEISDDYLKCCSGGITEIMFPETVATIGNDVLGFNSLEKFILGKNVKNIGTGFLAGNFELKELVVEDGNEKYDSRDSCNAIIETATNTLIKGSKGTHKIPRNVINILSSAFTNARPEYIYVEEGNPVYDSRGDCNAVIETATNSVIVVTKAMSKLPKDITHLSEMAIIELQNASLMFSVEDGNPVYDSRGNCNAIIETATNTLVFGHHGTIIPNDVTSIGERAFYRCCSLWDFKIPGNVIRIKKCAFKDASLENVSISNGLKYIDEEAFMSCVKLKEIVLPDSVVEIGDRAFANCDNLGNVSIGKGVKKIGENAFSVTYGFLEKQKKPMSVAISSAKPPRVGKKPFSSLEKVLVPETSLKRYKKAHEWSEPNIISKIGELRILEAIKSKQTKSQIIRMKYLDRWFHEERLTMEEIKTRFSKIFTSGELEITGTSERTIRNDIRHMEDIWCIELCKEGRMRGHERLYFYKNPDFSIWKTEMEDDTIENLRSVVAVLQQLKCSASQSKKLADVIQRIQKVLKD